jgi:hypothetical protein
MRARGAPQPLAYARVSAATQSVLLTALNAILSSAVVTQPGYGCYA